jgi:hypothetical protein
MAVKAYDIEDICSSTNDYQLAVTKTFQEILTLIPSHYLKQKVSMAMTKDNGIWIEPFPNILCAARRVPVSSNACCETNPNLRINENKVQDCSFSSHLSRRRPSA